MIPLAGRLHRVIYSVLLLWGDDDRLRATRTPKSGQRFAERRAGLIPGAHLGMFEKEAEFVAWPVFVWPNSRVPRAKRHPSRHGHIATVRRGIRPRRCRSGSARRTYLD